MYLRYNLVYWKSNYLIDKYLGENIEIDIMYKINKKYLYRLE